MAGSLFDSVEIGGVSLANRFVRSPTREGMCRPGGLPTARLSELYRILVRGGVGLIISGYTCVRQDGIHLPGMLGIDRDAGYFAAEITDQSISLTPDEPETRFLRRIGGKTAGAFSRMSTPLSAGKSAPVTPWRSN